MEQMTLVNNNMENTLIKGVKRVTDKVYRYCAIYDREWVEVKKYEHLHIIDGLETYIALIKKDGMEYWEAFEGVTGTVIGYSYGGNNESKEKAIQQAKTQIRILHEKGIVEDVFTKVAHHIINGVSPRYEGNLRDNNDRSGELKDLNVGDRIAIINLRGGLSYYTAVVDSLKHETRAGKEIIESKFISDSTGYYFYKTFGNKSNTFYYEPEFVELYERHLTTAENKVVEEIGMIEIPTPAKKERVWQDDLNNHLVLADKTDFYNAFEEKMIKAAESISIKDLPQEIILNHKLLTSNGFILTEFASVENKGNSIIILYYYQV